MPRVPVKRAFSVRKFAKGAGVIFVAFIALDLVATVITLAIGSEFLKK